MNKNLLKSELGIDEAGRGSILGPLVIAGVVVDQESQKSLIELDIKDSKLFGSSQKAKKTRYYLARKICQMCQTKVFAISAEEVDYYVNNHSLNILEQEKARKIISTLTADQVVLDGLNLFKPLVSKKVKAVNKADQQYLSVAAASIVAKSERDRLFEALIEPYFFEFGEIKGGGYANQSTLKFVKWHISEKNSLPFFYRKSYQWKYLKI